MLSDRIDTRGKLGRKLRPRMLQTLVMMRVKE